MKPNNLNLTTGIMLMLLASACTCIGQLFWKLANIHVSIPFYFIGFGLYGIGAILMVIAFRFGDLSILHPMLSMGYVLSLFLGHFVLHEPITAPKLCGILFIFVGMVLLGSSGKDGM